MLLIVYKICSCIVLTIILITHIALNLIMNTSIIK